MAVHDAEREHMRAIDDCALLDHAAFPNDTFPRHRHDAFVGPVLAALEPQLTAHADDDSSWSAGSRTPD